MNSKPVATDLRPLNPRHENQLATLREKYPDHVIIAALPKAQRQKKVSKPRKDKGKDQKRPLTPRELVDLARLVEECGRDVVMQAVWDVQYRKEGRPKLAASKQARVQFDEMKLARLVMEHLGLTGVGQSTSLEQHGPRAFSAKVDKARLEAALERACKELGRTYTTTNTLRQYQRGKRRYMARLARVLAACKEITQEADSEK